MPSRWDLLLEQKPVALVDHLLNEVAKLLAKDLQQWPLPIADVDLDTAQNFAPLLSPESKRPDPVVFFESFRIARRELEREFEASAEYFRNQRYLEAGAAPTDRAAILFISRWLVEQLLSLREHTHSKVTRPQLVDCLERTERRFRAQGTPSARG